MEIMSDPTSHLQHGLKKGGREGQGGEILP